MQWQLCKRHHGLHKLPCARLQAWMCLIIRWLRTWVRHRGKHISNRIHFKLLVRAQPLAFLKNSDAFGQSFFWWCSWEGLRALLQAVDKCNRLQALRGTLSLVSLLNGVFLWTFLRIFHRLELQNFKGHFPDGWFCRLSSTSQKQLNLRSTSTVKPLTIGQEEWLTGMVQRLVAEEIETVVEDQCLSQTPQLFATSDLWVLQPAYPKIPNHMVALKLILSGRFSEHIPGTKKATKQSSSSTALKIRWLWRRTLTSQCNS